MSLVDKPRKVRQSSPAIRLWRATVAGTGGLLHYNVQLTVNTFGQNSVKSLFNRSPLRSFPLQCPTLEYFMVMFLYKFVPYFLIEYCINQIVQLVLVVLLCTQTVYVILRLRETVLFSNVLIYFIWNGLLFSALIFLRHNLTGSYFKVSIFACYVIMVLASEVSTFMYTIQYGIDNIRYR